MTIRRVKSKDLYDYQPLYLIQMVSDKLAADEASDAFIAVINAPTHTHADSTVSRWDSDKEWPVYGGGHWFDALWKGDVTTAWNYADSTSRKAMEEAGLKPVTA